MRRAGGALGRRPSWGRGAHPAAQGAGFRRGRGAASGGREPVPRFSAGAPARARTAAPAAAGAATAARPSARPLGGRPGLPAVEGMGIGAGDGRIAGGTARAGRAAPSLPRLRCRAGGPCGRRGVGRPWRPRPRLPGGAPTVQVGAWYSAARFAGRRRGGGRAMAGGVWAAAAARAGGMARRATAPAGRIARRGRWAWGRTGGQRGAHSSIGRRP